MWAGLTFLLGFGLALWLSSSAVGDLRGPRAEVMGELNQLRAAARAPALRADRHLGRVAQQQAMALARGSAMAIARTALDLERDARSRGWRGSAPLLELRLRTADLAGALTNSTNDTWLEPMRAHAGVGVAPARDGSLIVVLLLDSSAAKTP